MPRTRQQNQQLRIESQQRLLAAARTTFARLGYDRATIRDIAQEAGVAQGLMYNYFRSKDDLLREVFQQGTRDVADAFAAAAVRGTPEQQLERVIRRSFEIVRERRDFWQLSYMVRHQPRTLEVVGEELTRWTAAVGKQLETLLRGIGHRDAPALARVAFAAIDGVAQHYVLDPTGYPLGSTVDCLVRHFCRRPTPPAEPPVVPKQPHTSRRVRRGSPSQRHKPQHPKPGRAR